MELVGRWWNGRWSRLWRRDIWLYREVVWHVHARDGDSDTGRRLRLRYRDERAAREIVRRLQVAVGPGQWRDITGITSDPLRHRPHPARLNHSASDNPWPTTPRKLVSSAGVDSGRPDLGFDGVDDPLAR